MFPSYAGSRKTVALFLFLTLSLNLTICTQADEKDITMLRDNYIKYLVASPPPSASITWLLKTQRADGTWPDIDYTDKSRGNWRVLTHMRRVRQLALAYDCPSHCHHGDEKVKQATLKGLKHWLDKDYQNANWWNNQIGVPQAMADILVLMGENIPETMVKRALATSLSRAKIGMTGQNKVWLAGITFAKCLITHDEKELKHARDVIFSEVRVTTKEGIQPDGSFHQHGPQQQFGNYGAAFGSSITQWALVFAGTAYALDGEKLSIFTHFLLNGPSWAVWRGRMDISGCGRQVRRNCQDIKARSIGRQLERMLVLDPDHKETYERLLKGNASDGKNLLVGNRHLWRSDMMIHRRPEWYGSVKMSSKRVIGAETCNSENMRGLHLGDGALYVYLTGDEYKNIQPLWDWHRLPGTTCNQALSNLVPSGKKCRGETDFVGGVSDGQTGVAALHYTRYSLSARKAWFFEKEAIVCLGTGITMPKEKSGPILTSVQQALLNGVVTASIGVAKAGRTKLKQGDWVHHNDIGYLLVQGREPTLQLAEQKGNWKDLFHTQNDSPQQGNVFSLWYDHGGSPQGEDYAYVIYPQVKAADMPAKAQDKGFQILANTKELQAIALSGGAVRAVFYKPGRLEYGTGKAIEVDTPCILMLTELPDGTSIFVSEPTQKQKKLMVVVDGKSHVVKLPQKGDAGKSVQIRLTH